MSVPAGTRAFSSTAVDLATTGVAFLDELHQKALETVRTGIVLPERFPSVAHELVEDDPVRALLDGARAAGRRHVRQEIAGNREAISKVWLESNHLLTTLKQANRTGALSYLTGASPKALEYAQTFAAFRQVFAAMARTAGVTVSGNDVILGAGSNDAQMEGRSIPTLVKALSADGKKSPFDSMSDELSEAVVAAYLEEVHGQHEAVAKVARRGFAITDQLLDGRAAATAAAGLAMVIFTLKPHATLLVLGESAKDTALIDLMPFAAERAVEGERAMVVGAAVSARRKALIEASKTAPFLMEARRLYNAVRSKSSTSLESALDGVLEHRLLSGIEDEAHAFGQPLAQLVGDARATESVASIFGVEPNVLSQGIAKIATHRTARNL